MFVSVVIPAFRSGPLLARCVDSVLASRGVATECIVVDNGADEATHAVLDDLPRGVRVLHTHKNLGFAGGANQGLSAAMGEYLALLNDDAELHPDALAAAVEALERYSNVAIVGGKIFRPDRTTLEHAGGCLEWTHGTSWHRGDGETDTGQFAEPEAVAYVTGATLVMRRSFWDLAGPLEPSYFMYYEETELCQTAWSLGQRVCYEPRLVSWHHGQHGSGGTGARFLFLYHRSRLRFLLRNRDKRGVVQSLLREPAMYLRTERRYWPVLLAAQLWIAAALPAIWLRRRRHQRRVRVLAEKLGRMWRT